MLLPIIVVCAIIHQGSGHGKMMDPVSRSSAWRVGFATPKNYNDNALYCGGFSTRMSNGGKCGVCGDPYRQHGDEPGDNEAGGKYASGTIVKNYTMGQTINIKIDVTANHFGWMEYRICPNNDVKKIVTQECLNKHVLERADGSGTKTYIKNRRTGNWNMAYKLPDGMMCTQCVIQWKYHAGNSWGVDRETGRACIGCGPQEEFYGCADVAIKGKDGAPQQFTQRPIPQPTPAPTQAPTKAPTKAPTQAPTKAPTEKVTQPPVAFTQGPPIGMFPQGPKVQTNPPPVQTPKEFIGMKQNVQCKGTNNWANDPQMDSWCTENCAIGNCPAYGCDCSGGVPLVTEPITAPTTQRSTTTTRSTTMSTTTTPRPTTTTTTMTTPKATTTKPTQPATQLISRTECKAINLWAGQAYLDRWCADSCARGNCPPESCLCTVVQKVVTQSTTTTLLPEVIEPVTQAKKVCHAIGFYKGSQVFDLWCTDHCNNGTCPADTCECTEAAKQPATLTTATTTTTKKPDMTSQGKCPSKSGADYWDKWCQDNCDRGYCESDLCLCSI